MAIQLALAVASAGISFMGSMQASRAAKAEGALTARNIKEQAKIRRLQALQEHNDIMANLQTFKAQNAAIAGTTGRDMGSDRSYKALLKNAEQNTKTLAARSNYQNLAEQSKYSQQALMAVTKANNLSKAYRYKAFGSLIGGAYKASTMV
tara:strand:+ start:1674 stop:2123 length:450 start_codon:yes stop_codon:yes gene_type:complete